VAKILGPLHKEPGTKINEDKHKALLEAIVNHLEGLSQCCIKNEAALLDSAGMQGTTFTLAECAEIYATAVDKDTGILAFSQAQRIMQNDTGRVLRSISTELDDLVALLKKL
jgi:hypothetical protein